jgi:hypothetical protein
MRARSPLLRRGERCRRSAIVPQAKQVLVLPITFPGGGGVGISGVSGGGGSGRGTVSCGVNSVTGHVSGGCGVTGGAGGSASRSLIDVAGSGVGGKCGGTRLAHRDLTTHPCTPGFDSFPRSVVFQVLRLEVWEYMLGAVGCPEHQCSVVPLAQQLFD